MWFASLILHPMGFTFNEIFMIIPASIVPIHMKHRFPLTRNIYETLFGISFKYNSIIRLLLLIFVISLEVLVILSLRLWFYN